MIYYELVKITINTLDLIEIILDMILQYYSLFNSIISDQGLFTILKFLLSPLLLPKD